jgi:hypothetical protein|tara:strand:+ start:201 stop:389 length:189 start_codon:yes stop_codon:yes gene_type:complete
MKSTIEVGDLVKRMHPQQTKPSNNKVYLVASVSPDDYWCILHDDGNRLTALRSLIVIKKGQE